MFYSSFIRCNTNSAFYIFAMALILKIIFDVYNRYSFLQINTWILIHRNSNKFFRNIAKLFLLKNDIMFCIIHLNIFCYVNLFKVPYKTI